MSISLSASLSNVTNVVLPIGNSVLRVASGKSGTIGTVTATTDAPSVTWSIIGAPAWVSANSTSTTCTINFNLSGILYSSHTTPYNFFVQADTGSEKAFYPVSVEVRTPLSILSQTTLPISATRYDNAVSVVLKTYGESEINPITSGVYWVPPSSLPTGLLFKINNNGEGFLYAQPSTVADARGGISDAAASANVVVQAYQPGSMYDSPSRAASLTVPINLSDPATGDVVSSPTAYVDSTGTPSVIKLSSLAEMITGRGNVSTYAWSVVGSPTGSLTGGFTTATNLANAVWSPTAGDGTITFQLVVGGTGTTSPTYTTTVGPIHLAYGDDWTATTRLKVSAQTPANQITHGYLGQTVSFGIVCTDLSSETATITVSSITALKAGDPVPSTPADQTQTVAGTPNTFNFTIPAGAAAGSAWLVKFTVTTAGRSNVLYFVLYCDGAQSISFAPSSSSITATKGQTMTPIAINATPSDAALFLVGAPKGISISGGNIIGTFLETVAGPVYFKIAGTKAGYRYSESSNVGLTVNTGESEGSVVTFTATPSYISPNQASTLTWTTSGTITQQYLQQNSTASQTVSGTSTTVSPGSVSAVYSLKVTSNLGTFYSEPLFIQVANQVTSNKLRQAPTTATMDEFNELRVSWNPVTIGSDPVNYYTPYAGWNILVDGSTINPSLIVGGTGDTRTYTATVGSGNHSLDMQGLAVSGSGYLDSDRWDTAKSFPVPGIVNLDKDTAQKGEPITITLDNTFTGNKWRVVLDGVPTEYFPLTASSRSYSFAFNAAGNHTIKVEVMNDFSANTPSVKLSRTILTSVYVDDQFYTPATGSGQLGSVGIGGDQGFEFTDPSLGATNAPQNFMTIHKSLVVDDETQEVKLFLATGRNRDASSQLGTMAVDVFPIAGRPHLKDLKNPVASDGSGDFGLTPVKITTSALPDLIIGKFIQGLNLSAAGGAAPYHWSSLGLPDGVTINSDGTITGIPTALGVFVVTLSVVDSSTQEFIDKITLNIKIKSDLSISTASLSAAKVDNTYSAQLGLSGGVGPFQWTVVAGTLPSGLSLDQNTGLISGTPTFQAYDELTTYKFVVNVADSVGAVSSKQLSILLNAKDLDIEYLDQEFLYKGQAYVLRGVITGGQPPYTNVTLSGAPAGSTINNVKGFIDITIPATATTGNYILTINATDDNAVVKSVTRTVGVRQSLGDSVVTSYFNTSYYGNVSNSAPINIGGIGGTLTMGSPTSPLPNSGVTATYSNRVVTVAGAVSSSTPTENNLKFALTLSGTSADGTIVRYLSQVNMSGAGTSVSPYRTTITVNPMNVGTRVWIDPIKGYYNSVISSLFYTNVQSCRIKTGFSLPDGFSLDPLTGVIYGTPIAQGASSTTIEYVDATNAVIGEVVLNFSVYAKNGFTANPATLPAALRGVAYSGSIVTSGSLAPLSATVIRGNLPIGLSLGTSGTNVTLTGTPTEGGEFDIWLQISDAAGRTCLMSRRFEVAYSSELRITTESLTNVIAGVAYSSQIEAVGGVTPYTNYQIITGTLPTGLSINTSSGLISGTTSDSNYIGTLTVQVTDNNSNYATKIFNLSSTTGMSFTTRAGLNGSSQYQLGDIPINENGLNFVVLHVWDKATNTYALNPSDPFLVAGAGTSLGWAQIRVDGITTSNPTITTSDSNILVKLVGVYGSIGIFQFGFAQDRKSPQELGYGIGVYTVDLTINDGLGRTKTATFAFTVTAATGNISLAKRNGAVVSNTLELLDTTEGYLYLTDGTYDGGYPAINLRGINIETTGFDPVSTFGNYTQQFLSGSASIASAVDLYNYGTSPSGYSIVALRYDAVKFSAIGNQSSGVIINPVLRTTVRDCVGSDLNGTFVAFTIFN